MIHLHSGPQSPGRAWDTAQETRWGDRTISVLTTADPPQTPAWESPPAVRSPLGAGVQSIPRRRGELRSFECLQLGGLQSAYAKMVKDALNLIDADSPGRDDLDPERRADEIHAALRDTIHIPPPVLSAEQFRAASEKCREESLRVCREFEALHEPGDS